MGKHPILAAVAAALGLIALPAAAAPAAWASPVRASAGPASTGPASAVVAVYACGMAGNWRCPAVRPGEVGFGALWDIAGVRWTHWTGRSAFGAGQYWLGPGVGYRADIALSEVVRHGSQRYFRVALITAPGHRAVRLWYGSSDGAVGWWRA